MYIVQIASELTPIAKVGGLADVVTGLCKELILKGHVVDIIIPKYDCIDFSEVKDLQIVYPNLMSYYDGEWVRNTVWEGIVEGLKVTFIDAHNKTNFFARGDFYNCPDNPDRFTYFSRVALEYLFKTEKHPNCIHCHDWHTALVPVLYHEIYKTLGLKVGGFLLTIHNLQHQGHAAPFILDRVGLNSSFLIHPHKLQDTHNHDLANLLKGGIVYSTYFTTVSPTYAQEVQTIEGGFGLNTLIQHYNYKFSGILNGLDFSYWNPETDRYLPHHYSLDSKTPQRELDQALIKNKAQNKLFLQKRLHFNTDSRPIVSCISRLVAQKGVHLIEHALFRTLEKGGQFILLGTSPDPKISQHFHELKVNLGANHNVHFEMNYNEALSHQIFAGSDMFIVPSIFEPCGLTQLIALRYGTVPIVRKTGGLADTIFDVDHSTIPFNERNGYSFDHADFQGVDSALDRAIKCWYEDPLKWNQIIQNGMRMDFSWNYPANHYIEFYHRCS